MDCPQAATDTGRGVLCDTHARLVKPDSLAAADQASAAGRAATFRAGAEAAAAEGKHAEARGMLGHAARLASLAAAEARGA